MKNIYSLKDLRKQSRLSQSKVAAALGISVHVYSVHEANPRMMPFGEVEKLAKLFNVSFNEVMELVHLQMEGFVKGGDNNRGD